MSDRTRPKSSGSRRGPYSPAAGTGLKSIACREPSAKSTGSASRADALEQQSPPHTKPFAGYEFDCVDALNTPEMVIRRTSLILGTMASFYGSARVQWRAMRHGIAGIYGILGH
jgi:hypothetical protein